MKLKTIFDGVCQMLSLVAMSVEPVCAGSGEEFAGRDPVSGVLYLYVTGRKVSARSARNDCSRRGYTLFRPKTAGENGLVHAWLRAHHPGVKIWLDVKKHHAGTPYKKWAFRYWDNTPMDKSLWGLWRYTEPNKYMGTYAENCVAMLPSGQWNNQVCAGSYQAVAREDKTMLPTQLSGFGRVAWNYPFKDFGDQHYICQTKIAYCKPITTVGKHAAAVTIEYSPKINNFGTTPKIGSFFPVGAEAHFACKNPAKSPVHLNTQCADNGQWSDGIPNCKIACDDLQLRPAYNKTFSKPAYRSGKFPENTILTIFCGENAGSLQNTTSLACSSSAKWTPGFPKSGFLGLGCKNEHKTLAEESGSLMVGDLTIFQVVWISILIFLVLSCAFCICLLALRAYRKRPNEDDKDESISIDKPISPVMTNKGLGYAQQNGHIVLPLASPERYNEDEFLSLSPSSIFKDFEDSEIANHHFQQNGHLPSGGARAEFPVAKRTRFEDSDHRLQTRNGRVRGDRLDQLDVNLVEANGGPLDYFIRD